MFGKLISLSIVGSFLISPVFPAEDPSPKRWQTYDGYNPEGYGRHIVFVSGDEEYRSEEALPQLAKILAVRHGFKCTVLFAQNSDNPGIINPQVLTNIPGLKALRTADCVVFSIRFRALPDDQMGEIDAYLKSGRPVIGMRTANHAFRFPKGSKWEHYNWQYKGEKSEWAEGFGGLVLGSWFFSHHGWHGHESTRGIFEKGKNGHQILKGINPGDVWGATDVYGVKEPIPGDDVEILLRGQVLTGMKMDSKPLGPGPYEKAPDYVKNGSNNKNDPMQALAWTKSYQIPDGRKGRAFCTTLGASLDLQAEGTRKLLVNAVYWCLGMAAVDPDVQIVDEFKPTPFKTYPKEYWEKRQLKVSDFSLKAPLHLRSTDKPAGHYETSSGGREGFGYDFANHPINRDRLYHFYSRQAAHFLTERAKGNALPPLLPHFPEVDGLENGHWGKYHKNSYRDRRFNIMDHSNVFSGIFRAGKQTLPRAITVSVSNNLHCAFDPVKLRYSHVWKGDFLQFNPSRWGIGGGISPGGKTTELPPTGRSTDKSRYLGHYRINKSVRFHYLIDGIEYFDTPEITEKGTFRHGEGVAAKATLAFSGPAKYADKPITLSGKIGNQIPGTPFAIDRIPVPHHNEFGSPMLIGGHDFFPNGDAAVCTMAGDVWRVTGLDSDLKKVAWTRIATGLNQPLGLSIFEDEIYVTGRDRISRLHDKNGDGEIDFYENFCDDFPSSPGGHDFYTGLQRDGNGYFYFVAANTGVIRVSPDGRSSEVIATGLRNANGIGASTSGIITTSTNEGDWTPASAVFEVRNDDFYGRKAKKDGPAITPAMAYIPRGIDNSSGGQIFVDSKKWGPLLDQLLHFSFGAGTWSMILRDVGEEDEHTQGAVVPLPGDFESGAHRGRFSPLDGHLYISGADGWGNYSITDGSFARVRYINGSDNPYPTGWKAHRNGIVVRFSIPITADSVKPENFLCQTWNYEYGSQYGSLEYSLKQPGIPGHDPVKVKSAHLLKDGYSIFLEMPDIQPAMQFHVFGKLKSKKSGDDITLNMFPTLLRLADDFTSFEGYQSSPDKATLLTLPVRWPLPFSPKVPNGKPGRKIAIEAVSGLQFSPKQITVKAGERITLEFKNTDSIPHNLVLIKVGSLQKVGTAANMMLSNPKAAEMHFTPEMDEVLHYSPMLYRNDRHLLHITAPKNPGEYPYVCTFPGHWAVMNGIMVVE